MSKLNFLQIDKSNLNTLSNQESQKHGWRAHFPVGEHVQTDTRIEFQQTEQIYLMRGVGFLVWDYVWSNVCVIIHETPATSGIRTTLPQETQMLILKRLSVDIHWCNPCLWDFKKAAIKRMCSIPLRLPRKKPANATCIFCDNQTCGSQNETTTCPWFSTVLHPPFVLATHQKIIYFVQWKLWGERVAFPGLFDVTASSCFQSRPPEERTDYHWLSGRKQSGRISPWPTEVRPLDPDKAFSFLSNTSQRKPIPKAVAVAWHDCQT